MRFGTIFLSLLCGAFLFGEEPTWQAQTEAEALFLRRIADFWEEGEVQIVKGQIEDFLEEYPQSSFAGTLSATLGDLYLREKNYSDALMQYARVTESDVKERVFLNRMHCLLEMQWFATLADECEAYLKVETLEDANRLRATYFLAMALYQQCLNASKDPDALQALAKRAQPYFQELLKSELFGDVAQAFAHLSCILKDYESASRIYLNLAEQNPDTREEMLFQAALLQSEFDRTLAMQNFDQIARLGGARAGDAVYNHLVLLFEEGRYGELVEAKQNLLAKLSLERQGAARLFFGRSHLQLKQYERAVQDLSTFIEGSDKSEWLRAGLVDLIEAAYRTGQEAVLQKAFSQLQREFPSDPQIAKGMLAQALLLMKSQKRDEARKWLEEIRTSFSESTEFELAFYESAHLEFQEQQWGACRAICREFLRQFPQSHFAPFAWRYLAASSSRLAGQEQADQIDEKEELAFDLNSLLREQRDLAEGERAEWRFLLAKTHYELKHYDEAIESLQSLIQPNFAERPNALLLMALCQRDGRHNGEQFCVYAEEALRAKTTLVNEGYVHIALFNAYLDQPKPALDLAAEHLFLASESVPVQPENLLWAADYYYGKWQETDERDAHWAERSLSILEKFVAAVQLDLNRLDPSSLHLEPAVVRLAELYGVLGRDQEQIAWLENLKKQIEAHGEWPWREEAKADLLLAEAYVRMGREEKALSLFNRILVKYPTLRSFTSASAALQSARLFAARWGGNAGHPGLMKTLTLLKDLVLQKTLANEPLHLEAALEYIELQTRLEDADRQMEKRLSLLIKTKSEFESSDDLLSKDYQSGRKALPLKDRIVRTYLRWMDAEIFFCRASLEREESAKKSLWDNARAVYHEIIELPNAPESLVQRVRFRLEQMEGG